MLQRGKRWGLAAGLLIIMGFARPPVFGQDDGSIVDDFDSGSIEGRWWVGEEGAQFECTIDALGYRSPYTLRVSYATGEQQYPACGLDIADTAGWRAADGLSFYWKSDTPNLDIGIILVIHDATQTNPLTEDFTTFEAWLQPPTTDWEQMVLPWDSFIKGDWIGESGTDVLDLSQLSGLEITVEDKQSGNVWLDEIRLFTDRGVQASGQPNAAPVTDGDDLTMILPDTLLAAVVPLFEDVPLNATVIPGNGDLIGYTLDGGASDLVTVNLARRAGSSYAGVVILSPDGQIAGMTALMHNADVSLRLEAAAGWPYTLVVYPLDIAQPPDAAPAIIEMLVSFK